MIRFLGFMLHVIWHIVKFQCVAKTEPPAKKSEWVGDGHLWSAGALVVNMPGTPLWQDMFGMPWVVNPNKAGWSKPNLVALKILCELGYSLHPPTRYVFLKR